MLANFHTHTTLCDGKNTPEEIVRYALDKGFSAIGFSGHGYTPFDLSYCILDTSLYIAEINRLKEKYKNKIQVYLGVEEDASSIVDREMFDYIIGSSHYLNFEGSFYPVDSNYDSFKSACKIFNNDYEKIAENYYSNFCRYILKRKPDIIGHFDLITKFDEVGETVFLSSSQYLKMSEKYLKLAIESRCIFEVNTGAISRGYRTFAYPNENLLHILKKNNSKIILSSDSHNISTLDFQFEKTKQILRDIGFQYVYVLYDNEFKKDYI